MTTRISSGPLGPRKRPRQRRSRETVEAILQAAAQVFAADGYAATTTNRIAERAGVSIGSLYQYFPNKDALLVALVEEHLREGAQRLAAVPLDRDVRTVVRAFVDAMIELHAGDPALHRVLFEEAPRPQEVRERLAALDRSLVGAIERYVAESDELDVSDPRLAAQVAVATVEALTHRVVLHPLPGRDPAAYAAEIALVVEAYLRAGTPDRLEPARP